MKRAESEPKRIELFPAADGAKRAVLASYGYAARGIPSPFNFAGVTGDVGALMEAIAARDPDRVPVAVVRAGKSWALVVLAEDFPMIRAELAASDVEIEPGRRIKAE